MLRAELAKVRTVRSSYVAVAAAFAANIGFAVLAAALIAPRLSAHDRASIDVAELALAGLHLSQIAFGLGVVLRSSAAAIATLFGLLFVPPLLLELLPGSWKNTIGPYVPMESGSQIYIAAHRDAVALGPWTGFGVFCLYAVTAVLAGLFLVARRDA